jgi:hypothetical protein
MGFRQPDLSSARQAISACMAEIRSPYNDGWVSSGCKHDLYMLKSWLDDEYQCLPYFTGEEQWEQQRLMDRLRQPER